MEHPLTEQPARWEFLSKKPTSGKLKQRVNYLALTACPMLPIFFEFSMMHAKLWPMEM